MKQMTAKLLNGLSRVLARLSQTLLLASAEHTIAMAKRRILLRQAQLTQPTTDNQPRHAVLPQFNQRTKH